MIILFIQHCFSVISSVITLVTSCIPETVLVGLLAIFAFPLGKICISFLGDLL